MTIVLLLLAISALMVGMLVMRSINERRQQVRVPVRAYRTRTTRRR